MTAVSIFIAAVTILHILGYIGLVYWTTHIKAGGDAKEGEVIDHTWDGDLKEMNNPMPGWWLSLFYLMIAFAMMPAAAARQWTHRLWSMVTLSGVIGALSGAVGSGLAVNLGKVPTGPVVVLVLTVVLVVSLLAAPERSVLQRRRALRAQRRRLLAQAKGEES